VVLAGGLGTRLRTAVPDRPKVLAQVAGRPFLDYLLDQLIHWKINEAVLCTGYLGEHIRARYGGSYKTIVLRYSQELSPLGTAGALRSSLPLLDTDLAVVLNGDSYCRVDIELLCDWHRAHRSDATMLLVTLTDTERYGQVQVDSDGRILAFDEKGVSAGPGLINAGIYLMDRPLLEAIPETKPLSLEKTIFPSWIGRMFYGYPGPGPFLDIGTPESLAAADAFFSGIERP
jgi:D-glycero-alpha-D-manno-heptose 1-phosphate guanylyltransferase